MLSIFKVLPYDFFYLSQRQFHDLGDWSYSAQSLVLFDAQKPKEKLEWTYAINEKKLSMEDYKYLWVATAMMETVSAKSAEIGPVILRWFCFINSSDSFLEMK